MTPLYTAVVTAHGGREGKVHADEPALDLSLAMPKSLGGPGGAGTNPEQLFAAGYAACFESALRLVARMQKRPVDDAHITAHVTLNKTDAGGFALSRRAARQAAGPHARRGQGAPRGRAPGLPVLAGDARQHRRQARGRVE